MKRSLMVMLAVALVSVMSGYAEEAVEKAPAKKHAADCKCCAKDCPAHIISMKDGKTQCCGCAVDCAKCGEVKDGKCACGKEVKTCDLAGMFACEKCMTVAAEAGKCAKCGEAMTQVPAKVEAKAEEKPVEKAVEKAPEAAK